MNKKRCLSHCLLLSSRRSVTTSALPADSLPSTAASIFVEGGDHRSLCLSLSDQLTRRGLTPFAQKVIQRIVACSNSVSDAASVLDFAVARGVELDVGCYGALIRKLVETKELQLAESFYREQLIGAGIEPDESILNSMIVCLCKLGKLDEARDHFDRVLLMDSVPSKIACNFLFREFFTQERFLEALNYFVKVSEFGVDMGLWSCNSLIDGLCYKGHIDEAIQMFYLMRERTGLPPTLRLYKSLFYGLCKAGNVMDAEVLIEDMESDGYFIDKIMYTSLIKGYCKEKEMKMAMRVHLRMLKMGCDVDNYTYTTLIQGYVRMGLFDKGWVLFNQMTERGMQPNVVTYHVFISNYCKIGKVDCASVLLENMLINNVVPSLHCYTAIIASLHKENRLDEADELWKTMDESGVVPDHILFFILMKMFPKDHELNIALRTLKAIAVNGCRLDKSLLNGSAYPDSLEREIELLVNKIAEKDLNLATVALAVFISALCERGNYQGARCYMEKMLSLGCRPLLYSYNSLIKCLCRHGLFKDAKSLIDLMRDRGLNPDQATYLIIVNEYCKSGDIESAFDVLDEMDMRGLEPTVAIYDSCIGSLGREGRIFEAENLFKIMRESGVDPDEIAYLTMINAYSINGESLKALQLFEEMVGNAIRPSCYTYTALISGLVKKGMTDKGCYYLDKMLGEGLSPNTVLYTSLIKHYLQKKEFKFTFRLIDLMDRNQIDFDHVTYFTLVSGICRNVTSDQRWLAVSRESDRAGERLLKLLRRTAAVSEKSTILYPSSFEGMKQFALKLIEMVKETSLMRHLCLYNSVIFGFRKLGKMEDAYKQLALMQREGIAPNQVTYTILMNGHIEAGETDAAIAVFNRMNAHKCSPDGVVYNFLLRGLCQASRPVDAVTLVYMMRKRGFYPSKTSYKVLLRCFFDHELSISASKIFKEMVELDCVPREFRHNGLLL